jgi:DNA-binding MarR family transcriptional regulator
MPPQQKTPHAHTGGAKFLVDLTHIYRDSMAVLEQAAGMSQTRLEIMHELFHADELSQAELQKHLGVEGAVVTRIVKQMEAAGLVTRRADPRDNRYTLVALSAQARAMSEGSATTNFQEQFGEELMEGLSAAEQAALLKAIARVRVNAAARRAANDAHG